VAHICQVHPYEVAEGLCRTCGGPFCADCLVYPFGPVKPPYCVPCAVTAAGVRANARNPTVVVPKETKRRLKEWRKARKRDLDSPPPDGVATWQNMDEAAVADDEDAAAAQAAVPEREALRLPPPRQETPTPPPGVNLAPPGPPGSDWRDEIAVSASAGQGTPGGAPTPTIAGESVLGDGWTGEDPLPYTEPVPDPAPAAPQPRPYTEVTYAGPATERALTEPVPDPRPEIGSAFDTSADLLPFGTEFDTGSDPLPDLTGAFASGSDPMSDVTGAFDDGSDPRPDFGSEIETEPAFTLTFDDEPAPTFGGTFEPTPFEPEPDTTPFTVEFDDDPLVAFGLGSGTVQDPLPPPPPSAEGQAFDPLPPLAPDHGAVTPAPRAEPSLPPPRAPLVAPHTRTTATPDLPRLIPPPPPTRHVAPDVPRSAIRSPTPTRIPAAEGEGSRGADAKALLARIAALREKAD